MERHRQREQYRDRDRGAAERGHAQGSRRSKEPNTKTQFRKHNTDSGREARRNRSKQSDVPDWLKQAMLDKKKEEEEARKIVQEKEMKNKIERQRESAGVAEKIKDEEDIPGVTFDDSMEANVTFNYQEWESKLNQMQQETMKNLLKELKLETLELRDLGKKENIAVLKKICPQKSLRVSLRKEILTLYSKINRKRELLKKLKSAEARKLEYEQKGGNELDQNSRGAQRRRQHEILQAFAKNRAGKGQMIKHKFNPKRLPKLFG
mmetsp:Transcript_30972/g.75518  ORF Transcript_30972/g.75518 Transcript_30972/m.75518 type:complete len:264 (-) Transcript_30972:71-862(-)